jgi:hypothetical protein
VTKFGVSRTKFCVKKSRTKSPMIPLAMEVFTWRDVIGQRLAGRLELFSWPTRVVGSEGLVVRVRNVGLVMLGWTHPHIDLPILKFLSPATATRRRDMRV